MVFTIAFCGKSLNNALMNRVHRYYSAAVATMLLVLLGLLTTPQALAATDGSFAVKNVFSSRSDSQLTVISQLELSLSDQAIDAIDHGVPISIVIEYARPKQGPLGMSHQILARSVYQIQRHSLSNRYLLRMPTDKALSIFASIENALTYLGRSITQPITIRQPLDKIAVRMYLDVYRLPAPLRFKAFFSQQWQHDSAWSVWPLQP